MSDTTRPLVLLTIGTDHHRFNRIIDWIEDWQRANAERADVIVQHGSSRAPVDIEAYVRLPREELGNLMKRATVIVTHGGGGSITQCWQAGRLPIVVPRVGKWGEHVDEHQEAFGARLAEMGYAAVARTYDELNGLLDDWLSTDPGNLPSIDATRPTSTTDTVACLIDKLVASRTARVRRFRRGGSS